MSRSKQPDLLAGYGSIGSKQVRGYGECEIRLSRMAYDDNKFWSIACWTENGSYTGKCFTMKTSHLKELKKLLNSIDLDAVKE